MSTSNATLFSTSSPALSDIPDIYLECTFVLICIFRKKFLFSTSNATSNLPPIYLCSTLSLPSVYLSNLHISRVYLSSTSTATSSEGSGLPSVKVYTLFLPPLLPSICLQLYLGEGSLPWAMQNIYLNATSKSTYLLPLYNKGR